MLTGSESILEQPGVSAIEPMRANTFPGASPSAQRAQQLLEAEEKRYAAAKAEVERLDGLRAELEEALKTAGLRHDVRTDIDERGLVLSLTSRHVVFQPDRADLSDRGARVLDVVAPVLRAASEDLRIDGHTNQVPVKPKYFDTDWDLSAARAVTVLRHLTEVGRIPGERMSAAAYGHEVPLVDPSRPGSQRVNKRVDIVVLSDLPAATRELLDDVAAQQEQRGRSTTDSDGGLS